MKSSLSEKNNRQGSKLNPTSSSEWIIDLQKGRKKVEGNINIPA